MTPTSSGIPIKGSPQSELELQFIRQYIQEKGFNRQDLRTMPKNQANELYRQACRYATLRLAEVEARAKFRHKIRLEER